MNPVIFTWVNYKGNAGDYNCSPFDYYKFPFSHRIVHFPFIRDALFRNGPKDILFKDKIIIIGGGGLIAHKGDQNVHEVLRYLIENNKVILWGIGSNTSAEIDWDIINHKNVLLAGIRDRIYGLNAEYLPCVSCKHKIFDKSNVISKGLGILDHKDNPINIEADKINNGGTIEEIVEFISSKDSIISSSYHGVYWSQLLNKKVLYHSSNENVNSKFVNLKQGINICNSENYKDLLETSSSSVGLLEESRYLNDKFYNKVVDIIQNLQK